MMDRAEASLIAHGHLPLWNPLSEQSLDETIELLDLAPGATVLDVGAGRGEVLRRVSDRWEAHGTGYDSDPEWRLILNAERSALPELRERAEAARTRLALPHGRETLGFALVLLRANRPEPDRV